LPDQSFVLNSNVSHIRLIPFNRSEISRTVGQPFDVVKSIIDVVFQSVDDIVVVYQSVDGIVGDVKLGVNVVVVSHSVVVVIVVLGDVELVVDGVVVDIHAAVVSR
jgi:hypothetical protein